MPSSSNSESYLDETWVSGVRQVVRTWLQTCNIEYPAHIGSDNAFYKLCYDAVVSEGYPVQQLGSIAPYLSIGVNMAITGYAHLSDTSTRVWIALYTTFLTASDDLFAEEIAPAKVFFRRMLLGQRQDHPALETLAAILKKTSQHFDAIQDAIILTSSFNFITALPVENVMNDIELPPSAEAYAKWSSVLSGAGEAYALFVFPREVPFQAYAHAIPDMMTFLRNTNDILSFYKEELVGENGNHVSLVSQGKHISKLDALQTVADESAAAYLRVNEILFPNPMAHAAWMSFAAGYVEFHVASKRYRLDELRM